MNAYAQVPLGEICTVNPRAKETGYSDDMVVSFVPMAAVDERTGAITVREERPLAEVSKGFTSFEDGDVLFAKITPCMENGKVALARDLTNGIGRGSTEFHVLRPNGRVLSEYIYHFVRQERFRGEAKRNFMGTAGQQRVPKPFMENVLIPLPPLDEQRRIVGILNRAARIERLRARAQELMEEFVSDLFARMFGNPSENPMGWEVADLGLVCAIAGGGTPRRNNPAYFGGTIPWATPTDVTRLRSLTIETTRETLTEAGLQESSARLVPARTVLLTSRATIGFTAIAAVDMATNQGFANLTCRTAIVPEYLAFWLRFRREELIRLAGGTTFKEVSKSAIKKMQVPLPPLDRQQRFAEIVSKAQVAIARADSGTQTVSTLSAPFMSHLLRDGA